MARVQWQPRKLLSRHGWIEGVEALDSWRLGVPRVDLQACLREVRSGVLRAGLPEMRVPQSSAGLDRVLQAAASLADVGEEQN